MHQWDHVQDPGADTAPHCQSLFSVGAALHEWLCQAWLLCRLLHATKVCACAIHCQAMLSAMLECIQIQISSSAGLDLAVHRDPTSVTSRVPGIAICLNLQSMPDLSNVLPGMPLQHTDTAHEHT